MATYEPKIQALLCKWCASAGADLAGVSRMKYPANLLPIQVMCSGRVDPILILRAFEAGADGVFIGACHPGDCHYVDGNIKAKQRIDFLVEILSHLGLDNRFRFEYVSASEGQKFKKVVSEFTEVIRELGKSPIGSDLPITPFAYTDHNRKKRVFHQQLKNISEALGYTPEESVQFDEIHLMEGYGYPVRDIDKCIGCYACNNVCPEQIITLTDIDNKRVYGTLSHACPDCKECEKICPQEALIVKPGFELMSFLLEIPINDIEHALLLCQRCDQSFTPVAHIDHIEKELFDQHVPQDIDLKDDQFKYCPKCRRELLGARILDVVQNATPFLTVGGGK